MWKKLKQRIWRWRGVLAIAPTVAGAAIALQCTGTLQLLEWAAFDRWFRLLPQEAADSRVAIVTIGEADISRLKQWPISDADLAKLLNRIKQQRPRAIGLDLYRNLPVEPGHREPIEVFASIPYLIGIEKVVDGLDGSAVGPPPKLREWDRVAASDVVPDADGKIRRSLHISFSSMVRGLSSYRHYWQWQPLQFLPKVIASGITFGSITST